MNRRNFVVGLGTVATISGVASVTAASFADEFESTADFRVIVDEELTVRPGDLFQDDDDGVGTQESDLDGEDRFVDDSINFEELGSEDFDEEDDDNTLLYINLDGPDGDFEEEDLPENDEIEIELAVLNDDENDPEPYEELLEIENSGATAQDVAIQYNYGDDVDGDELGDEYPDDFNEGDGDVDPSTVAELFTFEENGGDQLSPDDSDPEEEGDTIEVEPGTTQIDLNINLDGLEDDLADAADATDDIFDGSQEDLDLLEEIRFIVPDPEN